MKKTKPYLLLVLFTIATFLTTPKVEAAPGELDPGFANSGVANFGNVLLREVALQFDQRIVVAGEVNISGSTCIYLARNLPNGSPDLSFNGSGAVISCPVTGSFNRPEKILIQPDGKIVVVGVSTSPDFASSLISISRFNPNGTMDTGFGLNGVVTTEVGSYPFSRARSAALRANGEIIVVGDVEQNDDEDLVVISYRPNGSIDQKFGNQGMVIFPVTANQEVRFNDVEIQSNGKILAAGYTPVNFDFLLMRLNQNGNLDNSFGNQGVVQTNLSGFEVINDLQIQIDGRIAVSGITISDSGVTNWAIARYLSNGALDNSFGTGGVVLPNLGNSTKEANGLGVYANGAIVVSGFSAHQFSSDPFSLNQNALTVIRLQPNGAPDPAFGNQGVAFHNLNTTQFGGLVLQNDGNILVVSGYPTSTSINSYLTRLLGS